MSGKSGEKKSSAVSAPDWSNFRDHIPTADQTGKRLWIYPRKPKGRLTNTRNVVNAILLLILFAGPFIRIGGLPLLQMDIPHRKFIIFGQIFWPQDLFILAIAMVAALVMLVLFTAVYGRIWCGWLCPQTVLMEGVFRKIEYWIEGDSFDQKQLDRAPWSLGKVARKTLKHIIFFALSFVVGNWLLMYIIGSDAWIELVTDHPANHVKGLTAMILFSLMFYGIFARFREQACTFICPYGRFQSVLLDENSIIVAYDHKRGEKRGSFLRSAPPGQRHTEGKGDCVDCKLCVQVCPTGIDIRNGTQMECINCTACIDACNSVMDRVGFPRGLIRYASESNITRGEKLKITPRLVIYTLILFALTGLLVYLLAGRSPVEATILRSPGSLYQTMADGSIGNLYLVKVMNKTNRDIPARFELESHNGTLVMPGGELSVPAGALKQSSVIVQINRTELHPDGSTPIMIGIYSEDQKIGRTKTRFMGPSGGKRE